MKCEAARFYSREMQEEIKEKINDLKGEKSSA